MSQNTSDIWPDDIAVSTEVPPVVILRRQAAALGEKTKNIVEGEVKSDGAQGEFNHHFYIKAPALGNYKYHLFSAHHGAKFYPVRVTRADAAKPVVASSEGEFIGLLEQISRSKEAKEVISSLVAQSQAVA